MRFRYKICFVRFMFLQKTKYNYLTKRFFLPKCSEILPFFIFLFIFIKKSAIFTGKIRFSARILRFYTTK